MNKKIYLAILIVSIITVAGLFIYSNFVKSKNQMSGNSPKQMDITSLSTQSQQQEMKEYTMKFPEIGLMFTLPSSSLVNGYYFCDEFKLGLYECPFLTTNTNTPPVQLLWIQVITSDEIQKNLKEDNEREEQIAKEGGETEATTFQTDRVDINFFNKEKSSFLSKTAFKYNEYDVRIKKINSRYYLIYDSDVMFVGKQRVYSTFIGDKRLDIIFNADDGAGNRIGTDKDFEDLLNKIKISSLDDVRLSSSTGSDYRFINSVDYKNELGIDAKLPEGWSLYKDYSPRLKGASEYSVQKIVGSKTAYLINIVGLPADFDYSQFLVGDVTPTVGSCGVTSNDNWQTAGASTISVFCEDGCRRVNNILAYKYTKTNHGELGYGALALLAGGSKFKTLCFEYDLYGVASDEAAKLKVQPWDLLKSKDNDYFNNLIANKELSTTTIEKIQEFENFLTSIK
jgi:hypothetical protein